MKKQNDIVLNILANPEFEIRDFQAVGLTSDNTNLLAESEYLKNDKIKNNDLFKDENGEFDEQKFHDFYVNTAALAYNMLATQDYLKTLMDSALFSENNIWVSPEKRKLSYAPELVKQPNPELTNWSLERVGQRGERKLSTSEIAQSQPIYNTTTEEWEKSPNETFFKNFFTPLVLATYDEDEYDSEGRLIHGKGEYKYNEDDLPYYETLGGRSPSKKQVLNKLNILTTDGSTLNKFDFFDSDDIKPKSLPGTIMKNVALIAPMFIPYVGEGVIAASIMSQLVGVGAVLGKILSGSESPHFNNMLGWAKSVNRQGATTEYSQANTWTVENLINLVGDTVGLLAEQRWLFKAGQAIVSGSYLPYKALRNAANREEAILSLMKKISEKETPAVIANHLKTLQEAGKYQDALKFGLATAHTDMQAAIKLQAIMRLDRMIANGNKLGSPLAIAYMTGITTQDMYDQAKDAGASDIEAALLSIGYVAAEWGILNTELGKWVLPELHLDKATNNAVNRTLLQDLLGKAAKASTKTSQAKTLILGAKDIFNGRLAERILTGSARGLGVIAAHGLGESFEEVSEEFLADFSKSTFNAYRWLSGQKPLDMGQWDNMVDRYGMSALGGFIGGGIMSSTQDFASALRLQNMNRSEALQQLIHIASNDYFDNYIKSIDKFSLASPNLSATKVINLTVGENGEVSTVWAEAENYEDSQEYKAKQALKQFAYSVKNALDAEGARVSDSSLINALIPSDRKDALKNLRAIGLQNASVLGNYFLDYYNIVADLLAVKGKINAIQSRPIDSDRDKLALADLEVAALNKQLLDLRAKKDAYLNGDMAALFVGDAIFEASPALHDIFIRANRERYLEYLYKKPYNTLTNLEIEDGDNKYKAYAEGLLKNHVTTYALLFKDMLAGASLIALQQLEDFRHFSEESKQLLQLVKFANDRYSDINENLESSKNNPQLIENAVKAAENFITQNRTLFSETGGLLSGNILPADVINQLSLLATNANLARTYSEKVAYTLQYRELLSKSILNDKNVFFSKINQLPYINPEVKKELDLFIRAILAYVNEDETGTFTRRDKEWPNEMLRLLNRKSNTPIIDFLETFTRTVTNSELNLSEHFNIINTMLDEANGNLRDVVGSPAFSKNNKEFIQIIKTLETVINGLKVDNADYNNTFGYSKVLNELNSGKLGYERLAEIDTEFANLVLLDLYVLKEKAEFILNIIDINGGQKLKELDQLGLRKLAITFSKLRTIVSVLRDDDDFEEDDKNALISAIDDAEDTLGQIFDDIENFLYSRETHKEAERQMLEISDAIHNLFSKIDKGERVKVISKLLRAFGSTNGFFEKTDDLMNLGTTSISNNAFIWWLAARGAMKATDFYAAYSDSLSENKAPIPSLEDATYLGVAAITNMDFLNDFVQAYRDTVINDFKNLSEQEKILYLERAGLDSSYAKDLLDYFGGNDYLPQYYNMIFIEGAPGTGKTNGVFDNIVRVIKHLDESYIKNSWFVHTSKDNAKKVSENIGLEGETFGKKDFLKKLYDKYSELSDEKTIKVDGVEHKGYIIPEEYYGFDNEGRLINKLVANNFSSDELPKVIFIDEFTHYNEWEISMIELFARKNGIVVITAGDLHQNAQTAFIKHPTKSDSYMEVSLARNKMIRTPKMAASLRSLNAQMEQSNVAMENAFKSIDENSITIDFKYIENNPDHPGLFGVKVAERSGDVLTEDELSRIKPTIEKMLNTMLPNTKIGYIYSNENSPLYKYLEKYKGSKVEFYSGNSAQGMEGQYYIVENETPSNAAEVEKYLRSLNTGRSRAEQGTLVIAPNVVALKILLHSSEDKEFLILSLSPDDISRSYKKFKDALEERLEEREIETLSINPPTPYVGSFTPSNTSPTSNSSVIQPTVQPSVTLSPVMPNVVTIPSRIKLEFTDYDEALRFLEKFKNGYTLRDTNGVELTITGTEIINQRNDTYNVDTYVPKVIAKDSEGHEYRLTADIIELSWGVFDDLNKPTPIYLKGQRITTTDGQDIEILGIDETNGIKYTIKDISNDAVSQISQEDLLLKFLEWYVPTNNTIAVSPVTGFENELKIPGLDLSVYEETILGANLDSEKTYEDAESLEYVLFTFNAFETGVTKDDDGKIVFTDDATYKNYSKRDGRIDNAIGLSKIFNSDNYDDVVSNLGLVKSIILDNIHNTSKAVSGLSSVLGLNGKLELSFGFVSTAGRVDTKRNPKYDRFDRGKTEKLSYIFSDEDLADFIPRKKFVALLKLDDKPILEVTLGVLRSPHTIIQFTDSQNRPIFGEMYNRFKKLAEENPDNPYIVARTLVLEFDGINKYLNLVNLFKFWLYTANGAFPVSGTSVSIGESTGMQIIPEKGDMQVFTELDFNKKKYHLISINKLRENPQMRVSRVMMAKKNVVNGVTIKNMTPGYAFVLIGSPNLYHDDEAMVKAYLKELAGNSSEHTVKLVNVMSPTATVGDWLQNLHNIYLNATDSHSNLKIYDIGNDLTAYHIIKAMIDTGNFDKYKSSDGTADLVKAVVEELTNILKAWEERSIPNVNIGGQKSSDLYNLLMFNGLTDEQARRYLRIRQQMEYLKTPNNWKRTGISPDKTYAKALNSYLTGIFWYNTVSGVDNRENLIALLESDISGVFSQVYYKPQYTSNAVPGTDITYVDVDSTGYGIGFTKPGVDNSFRIHSKIDTPAFYLNGFDKWLKDVTSKIYFGSNGTWVQEKTYKDASEDWYFGKPSSSSQNNQSTIAQQVISKYGTKYADEFKLPTLRAILNSDTYADENSMLLDLAKAFIKETGGYATVYNNELYLKKLVDFKLPADVDTTITDVTKGLYINNALDNSGRTTPIYIEYKVDPTSQRIVELDILQTEFESITLPTNNVITDEQLVSFTNAVNAIASAPGRVVRHSRQLFKEGLGYTGSTLDLLNFIRDWVNRQVNIDLDIDNYSANVISNLNISDTDKQNVKDILTIAKNSLPSVNITIGNIIRPINDLTKRYSIIEITDKIRAAQVDDDGNTIAGIESIFSPDLIYKENIKCNYTYSFIA